MATIKSADAMVDATVRTWFQKVQSLRFHRLCLSPAADLNHGKRSPAAADHSPAAPMDRKKIAAVASDCNRETSRGSAMCAAVPGFHLGARGRRSCGFRFGTSHAGSLSGRQCSSARYHQLSNGLISSGIFRGAALFERAFIECESIRTLEWPPLSDT
jgi:hypothetical protein